MKDKKVIHILMTDYSVDSRVRNETISLKKDGYTVSVYCLKSKKFNSNELRENVEIQRFGFGGYKIFNMLFAYMGMLFSSINIKIDVIHAHDVTALPIVYLIAKVKGIPFIYDSHELWSQSHHHSSSSILLGMVAFMEKFFAKRATQIITVSDSIKKYMQSYFQNENIEVIRNIPSYTHSGEFDIFRERYNIGKEKNSLIPGSNKSESWSRFNCSSSNYYYKER